MQSYRWPTAPFSVVSLFGADRTIIEDGKEQVYSLDYDEAGRTQASSS